MSQNGWPAAADPAEIGVRSYVVPGTNPSRSLNVRSGDVAAVLIGLAKRFNATVEPIGPDLGGWAFRTIRNSSEWSNHASGTAIDLNSNAHGDGQRGTFTAAQVTAIRKILQLCPTVVRWGGDYTGGDVDEMHFEINVPPSEQSQVAACGLAMSGPTTPPAPKPDPVGMALAVTTSSGGRLDVFAADRERHLVHKYKLPGQAWSTTWEDLGGYLQSGPAAIAAPGGVFHVFARGRDNGLWHKYYRPGPGWSGWINEGGEIVHAPAATIRPDGRIDVFGRGTDDAVWQTWYEPGAWAGRWVKVGGSVTSGVAAVATAAGRYTVYARAGSANNVYAASYLAGVSTAWGWANLGGTATSAPAASLGSDSTQTVFVRGTDGALYRRIYPVVDPATPWTKVGGAITTTPGATQAGSQVTVVGRGTSGAVYVVTSSDGGVQWSAWTSLGGLVAG